MTATLRLKKPLIDEFRWTRLYKTSRAVDRAGGIIIGIFLVDINLYELLKSQSIIFCIGFSNDTTRPVYVILWILLHQFDQLQFMFSDDLK